MSDVVRPLVGPRRIADERTLNLPLLVFIGLTMVGLVSLLYLTQTSGVATAGYDIQALRAEKARWELRNDQLRLQISELKSLDRIEREAQSRLGMGPPSKLVFVQVDLSSVRSQTPASLDPVDDRPSLVQRVLAAPGAFLARMRGE